MIIWVYWDSQRHCVGIWRSRVSILWSLCWESCIIIGRSPLLLLWNACLRLRSNLKKLLWTKSFLVPRDVLPWLWGCLLADTSPLWIAASLGAQTPVLKLVGDIGRWKLALLRVAQSTSTLFVWLRGKWITFWRLVHFVATLGRWARLRKIKILLVERSFLCEKNSNFVIKYTWDSESCHLL